MKAATYLVTVAVLFSQVACAETGLRFSLGQSSNQVIRLELGLPEEQTGVFLERASGLANPDWATLAVQRPLRGQTATVFAVKAGIGQATSFFRARSSGSYVPSELRMRMLYNGYFLSVNPVRAMSGISTTDRYRLYVFNAMLVDGLAGRIAAIWPPFKEEYPDETNVARHVSEVAALLLENPPSPDNDPLVIAGWWLRHGVFPGLLDGVDAVNLKGAVVTPGLVDAHFHVSTWAKKVPAEGERFGLLPDVSGPAYYSKVPGPGRRLAQEALSAIVADANTYLTNGTGVLLHGFTYGMLDEDPVTGEARPTYLYKCSSAMELNPDYLLNSIGLTNQTFIQRPAVLVQISGQSYWYNGALLDLYNSLQTNVIANRFSAVPVSNYTPLEPGEVDWVFNLGSGPGESGSFYAIPLPADADLELPAPDGFWHGLPAIPRYDHHHPGPLYLALDIPYTLNTDPPSIRDPRPALTCIGAIARCPIEIDAGHWLDQTGPVPDRYPPDYLAKNVYPPLGLVTNTTVNPMRLTIEQASCAMTFWGAYAGNSEREIGALASQRSDPGGPG